MRKLTKRRYRGTEARGNETPRHRGTEARGTASRIITSVRPILAAVLLLSAVPALAQHDISKVDTAPQDSAIATPLPTSRSMRKYDLPDLAGAQQALGSQLIDGRLRKPVLDFLTRDGKVTQRVSIFEGGLVVVNMTGEATIRKKVIIPSHAAALYVGRITAKSLGAIAAHSLPAPELESRSVVRVYDDSGAYVERAFNPRRVLPNDLEMQLSPLRDLLRALSEDRSVTSSVAGYEPKAGDELVGDDRKVYRVVRVVGTSEAVVELKCLDAPTTIYVSKKDLHLHFVGANRP